MILFMLLLLMVLLSIAFFTLLERKVLGYIQIRKGPNKISFLGLMQPVSDGLKLFMKNEIIGFNMNKYLYQLFPFYMLFMMFMYWYIFMYKYMDMFTYSLIYLVFISGLSVYGILGSGWVSNSKYGLLGAYRSVAQVVSYELGMVFFLMLFSLFVLNYSIMKMVSSFNCSHGLFYGLVLYFIIWVSVILAELNRAPFDFAESESELVSGFNVEFGGVKFAFMFLGEYGNILFMSYFSVILFFSLNFIIMIMFMILIIWVRGTFPRYRYDNLMYMNWKIYLPAIMMMHYFVYMWNFMFY